MKTGFTDYLSQQQDRCNSALTRCLGAPRLGDASIAPGAGANRDALSRLFEASHYSLSAGGKRLRPILVYAAAEAVSNNTDAHGLDAVAAAVEMIHCYSLIHDDLPAMDDDDLRRGKPSLHKAYDEATAILAGDGLQALAYELLATAPGMASQVKAELVMLLARAAGLNGMVGGQALDMEAVASQRQLDDLKTMHSMKTGALIRVALELGGLAAGCDSGQRKALVDYGNAIGLAFQIADDVLDVTASSQELGKTGGKDAAAGKPTYSSLLGLDGAREEAQRLHENALQAIAPFGDSGLRLQQLAAFVVNRSH